MTKRVFLFVLFCPLVSLAAQNGPVQPAVPADLFSASGDAAVARRYLEWARKEFNEGRPAEALAALERGADYASASSDLSCFLAVLRDLQGRPRFAVLESCRWALETARWEGLSLPGGKKAGPEFVRLLEAKILTELRFFETALESLRYCNPEEYDVQYRRLCALKGLAESRNGWGAEFLRSMALTMDRFPRETAPVRLLFDYASRQDAGPGIRPLTGLAIRRLPVLIAADQELAYMAVPFIEDRETARRYTASYRAAVNPPNPASLPAALDLGLISGLQAVEELFSFRGEGSGGTNSPSEDRRTLSRELASSILGLLRTGDERARLGRNLSRFSGVITEDADHDGIVEARTLYREGMIQEYRCDADQDGVEELTAGFSAGLPEWAEVLIAGFSSGEEPVLPLNGGKRLRVLIRWERYPAVLYAELEESRYIPRPLDYFYTPFHFVSLAPEGPGYPLREDPLPFLTQRSLLSFAVAVEKPSAEFRGALERIELSAGIPAGSAVYLEGRKVAETEFRGGRPLVQRLDLDLDGRMETIRRYDPAEAWRLLSSESDWDGDGVYEYAETLQNDGMLKKFWDLDRDGVRETEGYQ
ncbi:MAG: hypothetical protein LBD31_00995 [Treponema sp.]|nr:hypothetical protein [Treponema sp.]